MSSPELQGAASTIALPFAFLKRDLRGITISSSSITALCVVGADCLRILLPTLDFDIVLFDFRVGFVRGSTSESFSGGEARDGRVEDWRRRAFALEYDPASKSESNSELESGSFEDFEIALACFTDLALCICSAFTLKLGQYITYLPTATA